MRRLVLPLAAVAAAMTLGLSGALATTHAGTPGVSSTTIDIGGTFPLSGPASLYTPIAKGMTAYFSYINARKAKDGTRGVYGRQIHFHVLDDGYGADRSGAVGQGYGRDLQVPAGRPVEIDGAAVLFALQGGGLEHLADGLLGQRLGVAGAGERFGEQVAVDDATLLVAQHHALVQGVEGLGQALSAARRAVDAQGGFVGRPLDRVHRGLERRPITDCCVAVTEAGSQHPETPSEAAT